MLEIDHLVVVCRTLQEGSDHVEAVLGALPQPGGRHDFMGTHNLLLSLGPNAYLEVIAIDPHAAVPLRPRWFGLDRFERSPRLGNWVCRSDEIECDHRNAPPGIGKIESVSRGELKWRITLPQRGQLPLDGACPGLIEWSGTRHPCQSLVDHGLRLKNVEIGHPKVDSLDSFLSPRMDMSNLKLRTAGQVVFRATISGPNGEVVLQ